MDTTEPAADSPPLLLVLVPAPGECRGPAYSVSGTNERVVIVRGPWEVMPWRDL